MLKNYRSLTAFSLLFLSITASVHAVPYSAYREPGRDWRMIADEHRKVAAPVSDDTILDKAIDWNIENLAKEQQMLADIPLWPNYETIKEQFNYLRDHRFLMDPLRAGYERAIPWRYAVDYCFERVAATAQLYNQSALPRPAKLFVFGNLMMASPYAPTGLLSFWYHVVPVVRDRETNTVYVLDPAVNFDKPLLLTSFLERVVDRSFDKTLSVNVCNGYAFWPGQSCKLARASEEKSGAEDLVNRLPPEWDLLQSKGVSKEKNISVSSRSARTIYGAIDMYYPSNTIPISDNIVIEYKSPEENDWNTLWDVKQIQTQMMKYDYYYFEKNINIGSVFGNLSRSQNCQCTGLSCSCTLPNNADEIDFRVMINKKIIKQCTFSYPKDRNLIDYQNYGPDIHYKFHINSFGEVDAEQSEGSIAGCVNAHGIN